MCTFNDRFPEYKTVILRCIQSCDNNLQLLCAYDMIERFSEVFKLNVPHLELRSALDDLYGAYEAKNAVIHII